jgi:hypothetical protein
MTRVAIVNVITAGSSPAWSYTMSAVRECNFPPDCANDPIMVRSMEIGVDVMTLFLNVDELAKVSPAAARRVLRRIAAELAQRSEGSA